MILAEIKEILGYDVPLDSDDTLNVFRALVGHLEAQEKAIQDLQRAKIVQTQINAELLRILGVKGAPGLAANTPDSK